MLLSCVPATACSLGLGGKGEGCITVNVFSVVICCVFFLYLFYVNWCVFAAMHSVIFILVLIPFIVLDCLGVVFMGTVRVIYCSGSLYNHIT